MPTKMEFLGGPELCGECNSGPRLANGLCLNCLLRGALDEDASAVKTDWLGRRHINARSVSRTARLWRWSSHNRLLAASLVAASLLGIFSVVRGIRERAIQRVADEHLLSSRFVAVLPFLDLDVAAPDEGLALRFAKGLQDQLRSIGPAQVTTVGPLTGTTTEELQRIARLTEARILLTGTHRQVTGGTRISLRLLDAATGELLLAKSWEVNGNGESASRLNDAVARSLYSIISRKAATDQADARLDVGMRNSDTREAILAGRELMFRHTETASDLDRAIDLFKKAVHIEPNSALAHAYLAGALTAKAHYASHNAALIAAETEARKAMTLAPESADAHRALAGVLYKQGQFQQALEELLTIAEVHGTDDKLECFVGMTLDTLGLTDRALRWYDRARKSTKRAGEIDTMIGDAWAKVGADEPAIRAYQRAQELQPGARRNQVSIARLRLLQGDFRAARRENQGTRDSDELGEGTQMAAQIEFFARDFENAARLYSELSLRETTGGGSFYGALDYQGALGRSLQELGRTGEAREILMRCLQTEGSMVERQPNNPEALYRLAAVESSLGLTDSSIQHLFSAVQRGWIDYRSLQLDPRFDSLRSDSRFDSISSDLFVKVAEQRSRAESPSRPE